MTLTIRQLMQEQERAHPEGDFYDSWDTQRRCYGCNRYWPCADYKRAVAALKALDEAERRDSRGLHYSPPEHNTHALIADPAPPTENT